MVTDKSKRNLRPKGFGKHPENINKGGRPKQFKGLTATLKDLLNEDGSMIIENVVEVNRFNKPTGKSFERAKVVIPRKDMIILAAMKRALKGDMKAIDFIYDRIEGKPVQKIEANVKAEPRVIVKDQITLDHFQALKDGSGNVLTDGANEK